MRFQIEIPKRGRQCITCSSPFTAGAPFVSAIYLPDDDKYQRKDYCPSCHEEVKESDEIASWRGVSNDKEEVEPVKDREERALQLLKGGIEEDKEAFYLALYLQRKKALIFRKEITDESSKQVFLFEEPEEEELFAIPKVDLTKEELVSLQHTLAEKLSTL